MISGCLLVTRRPAPVWDRLVGVAIAADGNVGAMISSLGSCHPDQLPIPFCRAAALGGSGCRALGLIWLFVDRLEGDELQAEFLGPLDDPVQMRLVDHAAGEHCRTGSPVHLHPFEQEAERFAQLAAKNQPVPAAMRPVAVHQVQVRTQKGDRSSPAGRFHLGEAQSVTSGTPWWTSWAPRAVICSISWRPRCSRHMIRRCRS